MLKQLLGPKQDTIPVEKSPTNGKGFIHISNLYKSFKTGAGDFVVLKDIDIDIVRGEFVGVIGKSGSGKSTLINMITGIDRPTTGEVWIGDVPVHKLTENQMAIWRGKNVGIVFQFFQLLPMLSIIENVMLPMDFCNTYPHGQRKERALHLLEEVDMVDHAYKLPTAISGGQQQRVAIARALANDPPILVADEPTGNLDSKTAEAIFDMFQKLVDQGTTLIMVTHDSSLAKRVKRTFLLTDGEIVNEYLAKAIPTLTQQQLMEATRNLKPMRFHSGDSIIKEGSITDKFYIITKGEVEVILNRPNATEIVVTQLKVGQYFGEVELMHFKRKAAATIRALTPVEVIALDQQTFNTIIAKSETTRDAIEEVAEARVNENTAARNGKDKRDSKAKK